MSAFQRFSNCRSRRMFFSSYPADRARPSRTTIGAMIAPMASVGARQFLRARAGVLILQACLLSGCAASQTIPNLFDTQARIERYVSSGEYDAAFAAVVEQARTYM